MTLFGYQGVGLDPTLLKLFFIEHDDFDLSLKQRGCGYVSITETGVERKAIGCDNTLNLFWFDQKHWSLPREPGVFETTYFTQLLGGHQALPKVSGYQTTLGYTLKSFQKHTYPETIHPLDIRGTDDRIFFVCIGTVLNWSALTNEGLKYNDAYVLGKSIADGRLKETLLREQKNLTYAWVSEKKPTKLNVYVGKAGLINYPIYYVQFVHTDVHKGGIFISQELPIITKIRELLTEPVNIRLSNVQQLEPGKLVTIESAQVNEIYSFNGKIYKTTEEVEIDMQEDTFPGKEKVYSVEYAKGHYRIGNDRLHGPVYIDINGCYYSEHDGYLKDFHGDQYDSEHDVYIFYFIDGVLMKNEQCFQLAFDKGYSFNAIDMVGLTAGPLWIGAFSIDTEVQSSLHIGPEFCNGTPELFTGEYTPIFSRHTYKFNQGKVVDIISYKRSYYKEKWMELIPKFGTKVYFKEIEENE